MKITINIIKKGMYISKILLSSLLVLLINNTNLYSQNILNDSLILKNVINLNIESDALKKSTINIILTNISHDTVSLFPRFHLNDETPINNILVYNCIHKDLINDELDIELYETKKDSFFCKYDFSSVADAPISSIIKQFNKKQIKIAPNSQVIFPLKYNHQNFLLFIRLQAFVVYKNKNWVIKEDSNYILNTKTIENK